jgi:hypothetical protein
MTDSTPVDVTAQTALEAILARLQNVREQLNEERTRIASLEADLAIAYREYQEKLSPLWSQVEDLEIDISSLRRQLDPGNYDYENSASREAHDYPFQDSSSSREYEDKEEALVDADKDRKKQFLRHLVLVLNIERNTEHSELVATLTGLCDDPSVTLADALQGLPWGLAWTAPHRRESVAEQCYRLTSWEHVLTRQLETLRESNQILQKDPRYKLWEQRQKGPEKWREFLDQKVAHERAHRDDLQKELNQLRKSGQRTGADYE